MDKSQYDKIVKLASDNIIPGYKLISSRKGMRDFYDPVQKENVTLSLYTFNFEQSLLSYSFGDIEKCKLKIVVFFDSSGNFIVSEDSSIDKGKLDELSTFEFINNIFVTRFKMKYNDKELHKLSLHEFKMIYDNDCTNKKIYLDNNGFIATVVKKQTNLEFDTLNSMNLVLGMRSLLMSHFVC